jgi:hypothetical protein
MQTDLPVGVPIAVLLIGSQVSPAAQSASVPHAVCAPLQFAVQVEPLPCKQHFSVMAQAFAPPQATAA